MLRYRRVISGPLTSGSELGSVLGMTKALVRFFATGFGAGRLRPGPGTFGTLVGVPIVIGLCQLTELQYMGAALFLVFIAIGISELYEIYFGGHDNKEIVIDEIAGFAITMTWLPLTWQAFTAGFLLFRILDIWKPFPIRLLDRKVQGGLGVVLDDVAAGLIANLILQILYSKTSLLGEKLVYSQLL